MASNHTPGIHIQTITTTLENEIGVIIMITIGISEVIEMEEMETMRKITAKTIIIINNKIN